MKRWTLTLIAVLLATGVVRPIASAAPAILEPTQRVEVHVTVTTDGPPFPVGTFVSMGGQVDDVPIDASGSAVIVAQVPESVTSVVVFIPAVVHWGPPELLDEKNGAARIADRAFSLPPGQFIPLVPGEEVYEVNFFAPRAVVVKGRAVNGLGQALTAHASRSGALNLRVHPEIDDGLFEVWGVPKSQDSFVFLSTDGPDTQVMWLSATQTGVDLDLGDVIVPAVASDAVVDLAVSGRDTVRNDLGMQRTFVTLIEDDGLIAYNLRITTEGGVTPFLVGEDDTALPHVAFGRYYIVPGLCNTSDSSLKVLRLIRSGQRVLLDAANLPVIEPVPGQTTSGAIDLASVQLIIDGLPE